MRNIKAVLFGYYNGPSCGFLDIDDGGFSIDIFPDGKLIYITYIFDREEKTRKDYRLSMKTITVIQKFLEENKIVIESFDRHTDNGSCDGEKNCFVFGGKEFITWNIEYCDEDELRKSDPEYYNDYFSVIKQQNTMITIFVKIAEILQEEGVELNLSEVKFNR